MSPAVLPVGHARAEVLILGRRIAAELAAEAVDTGSTLSMADALARIVKGEPFYPGGTSDVAVRPTSWGRGPACGTGPPSHGSAVLGTTVGCFASTFSAASLI